MNNNIEPLELTFFINGRFVKASKASISVFDHGFLFGDGVFQLVRVYNKRIFAFEQSYALLDAEAKALNLFMPMGARGIFKTIEILLEQNKTDSAMVLIVLTRGEGPILLDPSLCTNPTFAVLLFNAPAYEDRLFNKGAAMCAAPYRQIPSACLNPKVSGLMRLQSVMTCMNTKERGAFEAYYVNLEGYVTQGTVSSIFAYINDELKTPDTTCGVTESVWRSAVIHVAQQNGIKAYESLLTVDDLADAEELFITSPFFELMPVTKLDDRTIGKGVPGSVSRFLARRLSDYIHGS